MKERRQETTDWSKASRLNVPDWQPKFACEVDPDLACCPIAVRVVDDDAPRQSILFPWRPTLEYLSRPSDALWSRAELILVDAPVALWREGLAAEERLARPGRADEDQDLLEGSR